MAELAVSYIPLAELAPYPKNARTHSPEQIAQIAASMGEYGWTNPILVDERNSIIAGHGRALAASSLGMQQVPVIRLQGLTAAQKRGLRIADNKLALNASWSDELLRAELLDLQGEGFDLSLSGFSGLELADLLGGGDDVSGGAGNLADRFGVPPFSVLNAREGWWQDRKRAWLALGIQSELGRGEQAAIAGSPLPNDRPGYAVPGGGAHAGRY